jgi:hypothetical protein
LARKESHVWPAAFLGLNPGVYYLGGLMKQLGYAQITEIHSLKEFWTLQIKFENPTFLRM